MYDFITVLQLCFLCWVGQGIVHAKSKGVNGHASRVHFETSRIQELWSQLVDAVTTDKTHVHLEFVLQKL